jgi:hypothetical protein
VSFTPRFSRNEYEDSTISRLSPAVVVAGVNESRSVSMASSNRLSGLLASDAKSGDSPGASGE